MKFANLEKLTKAMGHGHMGIEALEELKTLGVGSFTRLAISRGLSPSVGVAAKAEFIELMDGMRALLAPARS